MDKYYANKGIERNKKPLQNIMYKIELSFLLGIKDEEERQKMFKKYKKYHFKDLGVIVLNWKYQGDSTWCFHGYITPEELKNRIGEKQWVKFCRGKREFIIQRRVNGKNIKLK